MTKFLRKLAFFALLVPLSVIAEDNITGSYTSPEETAIPVSTSSDTPSTAVTEHLKNTISVWAGAWQSQIPDLYLSYYTTDYVGPGYSSREEWRLDRQNRVLSPGSIKIRLLDFELVEVTENTAKTRFQMLYEKPGYADKTLKELTLIKQNGMWRISEENNISVLRL